MKNSHRMNLQLFATVHTGNTVIIKLNGQAIGRIQAGEGRRSFGQEGVYEIGDIMPKEHVPLRYEGGFTVDKFYIRKKSLVELGVASLAEEILTKGVIDIEVIDKTTNEVIRVYEGCSLQDYSESFRANAIAGENASFVYLRAR